MMDIFTTRLLLVIALITFISCSKEDASDPAIDVSFSVDKHVVSTGELVTFENTSEEADEYIWDFGDGITTSGKNTTHKYSIDKEYIVRLTARSGELESFSEMVIVVMSPSAYWAYYINNNYSNVDSTFWFDACVLNQNGELYRNREEIKDYYSSKREEIGCITEIEIKYEQVERRNSGVIYEIGSFKTSEELEYEYLVIWRKKNGVFLKKFEIIAQSNDRYSDVSVFDQRRIDWVEGANSHQVEEFVDDLYTSNAIYFVQSSNNLFSGNDAVAEIYGYMSDPDFSLQSLKSDKCERVNENLAYEIGVWNDDNAQGEYIIVWRKEEDGIWRILLDSNY